MKSKDIRITTIIGKGAECNGDFSAEGSVRIDGTVNGDVTVTGMLIVGASGAFSWVLTRERIASKAAAALLSITDSTELTSTAKVLGNINTLLIVIDENAIFQGNCNMNQEIPGKRQRPSSKVLRAGKKSAKEALAEALKEVEEANREENEAPDHAAPEYKAESGTESGAGTVSQNGL